MEPPIQKSVVKLDERLFRLGSSTICEECEESNTVEPSSILASWQDSGKTFIIRKETALEHDMPPSSPLANQVYDAGTSAGSWLLGNDTFCKVRAWCEGMEAESDTIHFVKTHCPSIPLPEVIFTWIDRDWNRSFFLFKRVSGKTLNESWLSLSEVQRSEIVQTVAGYCKELSHLTSSKVESASGKGIIECHLDYPKPHSHPSWKPQLLGPMSRGEFSEFLRSRTKLDAQDGIPAIGEHFHFYHSDLGPGNIMISEQDGKVTGILDWDSAGFLPKFWIALKVGISAGFLLDPDYVGGEKNARSGWATPLTDTLIAAGFASPDEDFAWWKGLIR
jgi:Phosphotransferase enzyme family